ncbi:MAG: ATP-binding protein [Ignavibacteria bacterium]|nr:ATP-binding protein [Ignavibacteria bacterium]
MKNKFRLQPKIIIIISMIIGVVMIASAYFELSESKKEIYRLLDRESASLIETIRLSSINTLHASDEIENLMTERLMDNARFIRQLDNSERLTEKNLIAYSKMNSLFRINILNEKGIRVLSNMSPFGGYEGQERNFSRRPSEVNEILSGKKEEAVIGLKESRNGGGLRFAVAVSRANRKGAIIINLDAASFLEFRKKIGIGKIVQDIATNPGIEYIVLQDSDGIIAASKGISKINSLHEDTLLQHALNVDEPFMREFKYHEYQVYEVIQQLRYENEIVGVFRIGLSMDEIRNLETRMVRRVVILSFLLAAFSIIVLSIVFTAQNLKSVSTELTKFKTFTGTVLENMGEAVIVVDSDFKISLFNKQAEKLFQLSTSEVLNQPLVSCSKELFDAFEKNIINNKTTGFEFAMEISKNGNSKYLSVTVSQSDEQNGSTTLVIKDLTEARLLEEQKKRNEKLSAMGELASGVAHEIRNPINAIGMIAQRLNREFTPAEGITEYQDITRVLKTEVERINKIITQFLNYAKPIELQKKEISSKNFFTELTLLFSEQAKERNIEFNISSGSEFMMNFDPELMKQTMMNLIQNAIDATNRNGAVQLTYDKRDQNIFIKIADNGNGISKENLSKIFNLYFTTKKEGNGLGLSIAQKIVNQHNGTIHVTSKLNQGTTFTIIIPDYEKL